MSFSWATPRYVNQVSYKMIPGFQLIDPEFVLRADSTGHHPKHDLFTELLPRLGEMVRNAHATPPRPAKAVSTKRSPHAGPRSGDASPSAAPRDAPTFADENLVQQAYTSIPHRRTVFDFSTENIHSAQKEYLQAAFHIAEQATVLRVSAYHRYIRFAPKESPEIQQLAELIAYLKNLPPPGPLEEFHEHLLAAIHDQKAFYEQWSQAGFGFTHAQAEMIPKHPLVLSASGHLRAAYGILKKTYPGESKHNQKAFFDYLCALDFI